MEKDRRHRHFLRLKFQVADSILFLRRTNYTCIFILHRLRQYTPIEATLEIASSQRAELESVITCRAVDPSDFSYLLQLLS